MHRLGVALLFLAPGICFGQGAARRESTVRELAAFLTEAISTKDFHERQTLKQAFKVLEDVYLARGKELPIDIDFASFKEENPDAPDLLDCEVKLPKFPRQATGAQILSALLDQIPTSNGTFRLQPGVVKITTHERASPPSLLGEKIHGAFSRRPLHLALEDVYDHTGVAVFLDPRVGMRARTLVSMNVGNGITLGNALRLMSETAGLKLLVFDEVIIITTPAYAQQLLWERFFNPYLLPEWKSPANPRAAA